MVLQRDQVTVRERHIQNTMLTRLNVSALIWGDFGLARAADDRVYTFAGRRPNLSLLGRVTPWDFVQTPQGRKHCTTVLQMGSIWTGCKGGERLCFFMIKCFCVEFVLYFSIRCKSWPAGLDDLLMSKSDCKFLLFL